VLGENLIGSRERGGRVGHHLLIGKLLTDNLLDVGRAREDLAGGACADGAVSR